MKPSTPPDAALPAAAWAPLWQAQAELARLQAGWSAAQWLQFSTWCERGLALALDAQRAWLMQLEAGTASALAEGAARPAAPGAPTTPTAPAAPPSAGHAVFDLIEQPHPATLLRDAQQAWRDIGAAWLGALRHDLREEAAAP